MLRFENFAAPFTDGTVVVPDKTPLAGLVPITSVTLVLAAATRLPFSSWTVTCTAGLIRWPTTIVVGWTAKASFVGAALTSKGLLVAALRPAAPAVSV